MSNNHRNEADEHQHTDENRGRSNLHSEIADLYLQSSVEISEGSAKKLYSGEDKYFLHKVAE
jgi:hypothetical protein